MYLASILAANSTRGQKSKRAKSTYPEISVLTQELGEHRGKKCIVVEVVYRDPREEVTHFVQYTPYTINEMTGKAKRDHHAIEAILLSAKYEHQRYIERSQLLNMFGEWQTLESVTYRVRNKNGSTLVEIFKEVEEAKMNGASLDELVKKYELTVWEGFDQDQLTFERDDSDEE